MCPSDGREQNLYWGHVELKLRVVPCTGCPESTDQPPGTHRHLFTHSAGAEGPGLFATGQQEQLERWQGAPGGRWEAGGSSEAVECRHHKLIGQGALAVQSLAWHRHFAPNAALSSASGAVWGRVRVSLLPLLA